MSRRYPPLNLKEEIVIRKIYSFHYTELAKDFVYEGEKHNFWEFLYVDKGELEITTDVNTYRMKQGDIVFYAPNEFHSLKSNQKTPSNIFIVSFGCRSEAMRFFACKSLRLDNAERRLLAQLIQEGRQAAFPWRDGKLPRAARVHDKHSKTMGKHPRFGSEQLVKIYLEALLIQLIRGSLDNCESAKLSTLTKDREEQRLAGQISYYLTERLTERLTLHKIGCDFALSASYLGAVFRAHAGCSIMAFFNSQKIAQAKLFIREETCNVSEIAARMGYSSIHYFSRQFKKETGMSPTEYLKTVKAGI